MHRRHRRDRLEHRRLRLRRHLPARRIREPNQDRSILPRPHRSLSRRPHRSRTQRLHRGRWHLAARTFRPSSRPWSSLRGRRRPPTARTVATPPWRTVEAVCTLSSYEPLVNWPIWSRRADRGWTTETARGIVRCARSLLRCGRAAGAPEWPASLVLEPVCPRGIVARVARPNGVLARDRTRAIVGPERGVGLRTVLSERSPAARPALRPEPRFLPWTPPPRMQHRDAMACGAIGVRFRSTGRAAHPRRRGAIRSCAP
jgi:hypothetical protein